MRAGTLAVGQTLVDGHRDRQVVDAFAGDEVLNTADGVAFVDDKGTVSTADDVLATDSDDERTPVIGTVDLVLTKNDDGLTKVAGGASFVYTITVDNAGKQDVTSTDTVTVTDILPAGLEYVLPLPVGCTAAGQTLTCALAASDLEVADPAITILIKSTLLLVRSRGRTRTRRS